MEITVESEMTMALVEQLAALPIPSSRQEDSATQVKNYVPQFERDSQESPT